MLPSLLAMSNPGSPVNAVLIMAVILFGFQTAIGMYKLFQVICLVEKLWGL